MKASQCWCAFLNTFLLFISAVLLTGNNCSSWCELQVSRAWILDYCYRSRLKSSMAKTLQRLKIKHAISSFNINLQWNSGMKILISLKLSTCHWSDAVRPSLLRSLLIEQPYPHLSTRLSTNLERKNVTE